MSRLSFSAVIPAPLQTWPGRRWVLAALLVGPLVAGYASVGPPIAVLWAMPAALWCALPAAVLLASYPGMSGSGRWLDDGCSPCAALSGLAVVGSFVMRDIAPLDPGIALVAGLMVVFGLLQRVGAAASCAASSR